MWTRAICLLCSLLISHSAWATELQPDSNQASSNLLPDLFQSGHSLQQEQFLSMEQAFMFEAKADSREQVTLSWLIAKNYYLYRHRFKFIALEGATLGEVSIPKGKLTRDDYYGEVEIYAIPQLIVKLPLRNTEQSDSVTLQVSYQGCAAAGLCYPPEKKKVHLDLSAFPVITNSKASNTATNTNKIASNANTVDAQVKKPAGVFQVIKGIAELDAALAAAKGKFVMLDFYADWCTACKQMEKFTFSNQAVQANMTEFVLLKADVTQHNAQDKALYKRFGILGPPAILFFDPQGNELRSQRVVGFMKAAAFLQRLTQVLKL